MAFKDQYPSCQKGTFRNFPNSASKICVFTIFHDYTLACLFHVFTLGSPGAAISAQFLGRPLQKIVFSSGAIGHPRIEVSSAVDERRPQPGKVWPLGNKVSHQKSNSQLCCNFSKCRTEVRVRWKSQPAGRGPVRLSKVWIIFWNRMLFVHVPESFATRR